MNRLPFLLALLCLAATGARGAEGYVPFAGEKSTWHDGFERYDFALDEKTLAITPFHAPPEEHFGIGRPAPGTRRGVVIVPRQAAPGAPWSWRGCYWDHEPQTEVELLRRGFHVAYLSADTDLKPGPEWDAWYRFLTRAHGLSAHPNFIGMSRGGEYAYTWATRHPDSVSCLCVDNPGGNEEIFRGLAALAQHDVPVLQVCGSIDPLLPRVALPIEAIYQQFGGRMSMMIKEGFGHHPHSLRDPTPLADWIEQNTKAAPRLAPPYVGDQATHSVFYGVASQYREFPKEHAWLTLRGAAFADCYDAYRFELPPVQGGIVIYEPKKPAPGNPWVFRVDPLQRDSAVELGLLAKGFRIVVAPMSYNANAPLPADWDRVFQHLSEHGLSKRAVLAGRGGAAGEMWAWGLANPGRIACLYAENPLLRAKAFADLTPLQQFKPPMIIVAGSADPGLAAAQEMSARYRTAGGPSQLVVEAGAGHYPTGPTAPQPLIENIVAAVQGTD